MTHNSMQCFLKHALRILIEPPRRFLHYFFQLRFRFFANAFYHITYTRIQLFLKLLSCQFESFLLAGFLVSAIVVKRLGHSHR